MRIVFFLFLLVSCNCHTFATTPENDLLQKDQQKHGQLKENIQNLLKEYPLDPALIHHRWARRLIDMIELCDAKTPYGSTFLNKTHFPKDPLEIYRQFARSLGGMTYKTHDLVWSHLGGVFLGLALRSIDDEEQMNSFKYVYGELQEKLGSGRTNYRWFSLWVDRLSILMTKETQRGSFHSFNTYFDRDKAIRAQLNIANRKLWHRHKDYKLGMENQGNVFLRNHLSLNAVAMQQFPSLVPLPYPFELDAFDLVQTMPSPRFSRFWPLGFAFKNTPFDAVESGTPSIFYAHDMGHLQILLISLLNQTVLYQKEFSQLSEVPVKHLITQRKNYYRLVEACQKVLKETTGDTRTIYSFLAFRLLHEGAESVEKKHERIFGDPYNFKDRELILILNPLYYKSLLPKDFQAITDRDVMREKLLPYGRTFQQLVKNAHDRAYKKYRFPLSPDAIKPIVSFVSCLNILRANTENICAESHRAPVNLAHELTYLPDTEQHIRQYVGKDIKQWIATNSIFELDPSKIQFVEYVGSFED